MKCRSGYTLIELLVVIVLIGLIAVVTTLNLQGGKNANDLNDATHQVATLLREAQSDSVAQEDNAAWGVYFSNITPTGTLYALFNDANGSLVTVSQYVLPSSVGWASTFLPSGATTSILFTQISGTASASTTVGLYSVSQPSLTTSIIVASSGAVSD